MIGMRRRVAGLVRVLVMLVRPPVLVVIMLFAALGIAQSAPRAEVHPLFTTVLVIIGAWLVNAAALNDLADEQIDRVNLANARGRPLVSGQASRRQMLVLALVTGSIALAVAGTQGWRVAAVVAGGLALNAAYSLPPLRLSHRGIVASLVLPVAFVVVPYLVGSFTVRPDLGGRDLVLLPGLYVGFIGRILLKDFRDAAGDALFGKWTFLLRHGRATTCRVSAACWVVGTVAVLAVVPFSPWVVVVGAVFLGCALHGLVRLSTLGAEPHVVADQVVIGAIAQAGRGICITVLAHLTMRGEGWSPVAQAAVVAVLGLAFVVEYLMTLAEKSPQWALRPT